MTNMAITVITLTIKTVDRLPLIDLHSHILPGIDDGARTLDDTIALARQASEQGVTHMVCTPHIHLGTFNNTQETIAQAFELARDAIHEHKIPLKLSYSCEVRLGIEITQWVEAKSLPLLGAYKGKSALLLELPHSHIPAGTDSLIHWLLKRNIQPIIPHPERNRDILDNYDKATWLKRLGVLFQATAGAFVGTFGERVEQTVWRMLDDKLISYVASDMHNLHKRPNEMKMAYQAISNIKGEMIADNLLYKMPQQITEHTHWQ
jgi:protein-tyrosine phosphatase